MRIRRDPDGYWARCRADKKRIKAMRSGAQPTDVAWLKHVARQHENEDLRRAAVIALQVANDDGLEEFAMTVLLDEQEDEFVRREGLFILETPDREKRLLELLVDQDFSTFLRTEIAGILERSSSTESAEALMQAISDPNSSVSRTAKYSLRQRGIGPATEQA